MNILITDEQLNGTITNQFEIEFENKIISTGELIEKRVTHEVKTYNQNLPQYYRGLIEPTESEKTLNGYKLKPKQIIDKEKQIYLALAAFQKNGFFVLVDNEQLEELDQMVEIKTNSKISFIKLTPLIGG